MKCYVVPPTTRLQLNYAGPVKISISSFTDAFTVKLARAQQVEDLEDVGQRAASRFHQLQQFTRSNSSLIQSSFMLRKLLSKKVTYNTSLTRVTK